MGFVSADAFNRHDMAHILKFMGYEVKKVGIDVFAELTRETVGMEKKYIKIFTGNDAIQRCYPYKDDQSYTNIRLLDKYCKLNNVSYSVFEFIEKNAGQLKFNVPQKLQISDLDEYKKKDLGNIICGLGFALRKDKSTRNNPVYEGEYLEGGKRILVVKQNKNGEYVCFDNTRAGKVLDCISLIKDYYPSFKLFHIKQELDRLSSQENRGGVPSKKPLTYCYLKDGFVSRYMVLRGFDRDFLLKNKSLKGILRTEVFLKDEKEYANQAYIIRDVNTGKDMGYIRRNISLYHRNLKGFSGAKNGLFYSHFTENKKSTILFAESFENSFSYYQMNLHKLGLSGQIIIVATGGNPSNTQKEQFASLVSKVQLVNLYLLGDNDIGGQKFNCYAIQKLVGEDIIQKIETNEKESKISIYSYDLEFPKKLGKKLDFISEQVEDIDHKKMAKVSIEYDWQKFKKLNDIIISKYLDKEKIIIKTAEENDFNHDLMKKTGMLKYLEDARKFEMSDYDLLNDPKEDYMLEKDLAKKNIDHLAEDIKEGRLTAINAVELFKEEGERIPGKISSNLKKVFKGKAKTKEQIYNEIENEQKRLASQRKF